ncbi:hypothetical protein O6H91_13G024100 [Diphasiastrum complanatum]|uniref:Uncharacterized protein n=1 Tax=Diphasiastrum complanatum TaxID=34168 RepID=A0ACC2BSX0_DIPCM|nr:hypothetical protein O6H91_Y279600 [Diphasiastrum complanatum]KAJ7532886.1 hypothetical protein O6H91_13G024100 [Diphasiastrum complanatum]
MENNFSQSLNSERVDLYERTQFADIYDKMPTESCSSTTFDLLSYPVKDVNSMVSHVFPDELPFCASLPSTSSFFHMDSTFQTLKTKDCTDSNQIFPQMVSFNNSSMPSLFGPPLTPSFSQFPLPDISDEDERALVKHKTCQEEYLSLEYLKNVLPFYESGFIDDDARQIINNCFDLHRGNATDPVNITSNYTSALDSSRLHNYFVESNTGICDLSTFDAILSKQFVNEPRRDSSFNQTLNSLPSFSNHGSILTCDSNTTSFSHDQQPPQPFATLTLQNPLEHSSPDYPHFYNSRQKMREISEPLRLSCERNESSFDRVIVPITSPPAISFNTPAADGLEYPKTPSSYSLIKINRPECESLQSTRTTISSATYLHYDSNEKTLRTNMCEELQVDSAISGESQCKSSVTTPHFKQEGSRKRTLYRTCSAQEDSKAKRRLQFEDGNSTVFTRSSSWTSLKSCCNTLPDTNGDRKASTSPKESIDQALSDQKPRTKQGCANDPQSIAARNRRERISERLKILQDLVPNGTKVDLVTMLEKAISYVKFLQLQVKVLATDEYWPNQENDKLRSSDSRRPNLGDMSTDGIATAPEIKDDIDQTKNCVSSDHI